MLAQAIVAVAGVWLMAAPAVLGYTGTVADTSDRIVGPAIASIAFLAAPRILRGLRWLNMLAGLWLVVAPWLLNFPPTALLNSLAVGVLVLFLAPVGHVEQDGYGGGWLALFADDPPPTSAATPPPARRR
jgi:hypothetical protein